MIQSLVLRQHDVLAQGGLWPIATEIVLGYSNHPPARLRVQLNSAQADFGREAHANACPQYVFTNDQDYAYGRFLLDERSRKAVMAGLGSIDDVFERTLLWGSLWDSVREAELDPRDYIELALRLVPDEKDEALAQSIIARMTTALHRYVSAETRAVLVPRAEALAYDQMLHSSELDMRIIWFRALGGVAETSAGRGELKDMLSGKLTVPGVELRPLDRWHMVTVLVALGDPDGDRILSAEQKRDTTGDGRKYAYMAAAARPDSNSKRVYFDGYLHDSSRPEDWVGQSLEPFNSWNQSELTLPYLRSALDALPQVKRERKIFFLLAWLNAFIGGQQSPQARALVHDFLNTATLDRDVRLKILEVSDELDRTVKIRDKFAPAKMTDVGSAR